MRALLDAEMLAPEVPADVHQLRGIERGFAAPRCAGGVRAFTFEAVLDRHEAILRAVAPRDAEVLADVREDRDVDVLEEAGTDVVRLRADELFGDPGPQHQRALQMLLLHHLLDGERRRNL